MMINGIWFEVWKKSVTLSRNTYLHFKTKKWMRRRTREARYHLCRRKTMRICRYAGKREWGERMKKMWLRQNKANASPSSTLSYNNYLKAKRLSWRWVLTVLSLSLTHRCTQSQEKMFCSQWNETHRSKYSYTRFSTLFKIFQMWIILSKYSK